jgi:tRNA(Ile)-lysidine synthase
MGPDPRQLFSRLDAPSGAVLAVSGGSDSLALLLLAHHHFHEHGLPLLAVTVDHRLRPEAEDEAETVAAFCRERGIPHRIMVWDGEKPSTGVSEAAREARYRLLAQAAGEAGTNIILVGHTMDDQAETVAMRLARGEGSGLAGMADATLYDERFWILRPLLSVRRKQLRAYLSAQDVRWIDDPSNESETYERVRVRQSLDDHHVLALTERARIEGEQRHTLAEAAAAEIKRHVTMPLPGLFRVAPQMVAGPSPACIVALRALLATAGGTPRLPNSGRAEALSRRLEAGEKMRATLSRAVIDRRRDAVFIWREDRDVPTVALNSDEAIWDGRWRIRGGRGHVVSPTCPDLPEDQAIEDVPNSIARAARSVLPALSPAEVGATAGSATIEPLAAPFSRFLPEFDLALAQAVAKLIGSAALPPLPWKQQIDTQPLTERGASAWQGPARCLC